MNKETEVGKKPIGIIVDWLEKYIELNRKDNIYIGKPHLLTAYYSFLKYLEK